MSTAVAEAGRVRSMVDFYLTTMRTSISVQFQYRAANYLYMIGMVAEPVIYLVVWSTVARQQGGEVDGFTPDDFAAYYIVWTLVRNMNIVLTPFAWEQRIREGELSGMLLRPMHPMHYDLAYFAGWKVVVIVLWLPIAVVLSLVFHPSLSVTAAEVVAFAVAIWGAFLIRSFNLWLLGMITFWTTRVSALFDTYFVLELLLSGRLVPLELMPSWVQDVAAVLPFKWTFGFPIEALTADLSGSELLAGLGMQLVWIVVGIVGVRLVWRVAVRRYSAVNN
jgi:ABC-2 type transport system permease protein